MKKICFIALIIIMLCFPFVTVCANAPAPPSYFFCQVENIPANLYYVDILIEINPQSTEYTPFNSKNAVGKITAESPIATYNEDCYMSLSFHYMDVSSHMESDSPCFRSENYNQSIDKISKTIKVALLDKYGNILQISNTVDTTPATSDEFAYRITYDAKNNVATLNYNHFYKGSSKLIGFTIPLLLAILLCMILSIGVETLIAIPFKIKPIWKIAIVNLFTQFFLIIFMSVINMTYIPSLIIAEIFIYLSEIITYFLMFREIPKWKIIIYTIVANTVSLIMGLLLNAFAF